MVLVKNNPQNLILVQCNLIFPIVFNTVMKAVIRSEESNTAQVNLKEMF